MDFNISVDDLLVNRYAAGPNGDSSYKNTTGVAKQAWTNKDNQEFWYAESYSFVNTIGNELSGYQIKVGYRNGPKPNAMLLSCGDQTVVMQGSVQQGWSWWIGETCPQTGGNLSSYLKTLSDTGSPGVVQMTLQPFDVKNPNDRSIGQGFRSALLCFGPDQYDGGNARKILASQLPAAAPIGGDSGFWVGGLAQYIIQNRLDPAANYCLVIDQEINLMGALSCGAACVDGKNLFNGTLDLSGKWSVFGTHRVNGYQAYIQPDNGGWQNEAQRKICTGLLDISTGYQANPSQDDYAIDVAGVTFAYPGKRNEGAVQLNAWNTFDWSGATASDSFATLRRNLVANQPKRMSRTPHGQPAALDAVKVFDTKIIGGWADASDGIETMAAESFFDRNFFHVNDDSIKLRAANVTFNNTTLWQGNVGAAINPSAYGYVDQSIEGCQVKGVFVHRVTHRFNPGDGLAQDDDLGALISNRTGFSDDYFETDNDVLSLQGLFVSGLYVPSLVNDAAKQDANSISRVIVLSAINPAATGRKATRVKFYPKPTRPVRFRITGIQLVNIQVNYPLSFNANQGFSKGMICAGDFEYASLKDGFSRSINYVTKAGNPFEAPLEINAVDFQ
ncbi:MAG: hypothetical protein P8I27_00230 [Pirellulaceae bacterium]|nr:hypothetical protein [Pirellulaceae bacterium]